MRKLLLVACLCVLGASCEVNQEFVASVDEAWKVIEPRYVEYIENDETLDAQEKATRKRTATLLTITIDKAKE